MPLPRLVGPTAEPLFSPERSSRQRNSRSNRAIRLHPTRPEMLARPPARALLPPRPTAAANRCSDWGTHPGDRASEHLSSAPKGCPPTPSDHRTEGGLLGDPLSPAEATARSSPTARLSVTDRACAYVSGPSVITSGPYTLHIESQMSRPKNLDSEGFETTYSGVSVVIPAVSADRLIRSTIISWVGSARVGSRDPTLYVSREPFAVAVV